MASAGTPPAKPPTRQPSSSKRTEVSTPQRLERAMVITPPQPTPSPQSTQTPRLLNTKNEARHKSRLSHVQQRITPRQSHPKQLTLPPHPTQKRSLIPTQMFNDDLPIRPLHHTGKLLPPLHQH